MALMIAIEPWNIRILGFDILKERIMFMAEKFTSGLIKIYDSHPISKDGGTWYIPQARHFLKLKQYLYSSYGKSIVERTMQYIEDRTTESFDDYFPCRMKKCKLKHLKNWLILFVNFFNKENIS
jgi:putative transposase